MSIPPQERQPQHGLREQPALSRRDLLSAGAAGLAAVAAPTRVNPQGRFVGRVVLITGATSGIGEATAKAFAREGAKVFFCGRREELGRQVEAAIKAKGGEAMFGRADVRREQDVEGWSRRALHATAASMSPSTTPASKRRPKRWPT